ncbi:magnesium transporter CorA [Rhodoferax lacus]|uniref:Magnesium transporter CorA n=1 Tax=Rhodoferax lacus TaxID=2184758 RepID=A0A3E1R861_9BURK|nr:magnesium transporter CorA family protein [Rhodoferax lacus]RFO95222.1 magnesium transporter CorA [Rhodoferax lacus]
MRIFHIQNTAVSEGLSLEGLLQNGLPATGFVWISCTHSVLEAQLGTIQAVLQQLCGQALLDLHVSDLLNTQLPSHYDYTSQYDVVVFRRLATAVAATTDKKPPINGTKRGGPPILRRIDTNPVGFAIFDRVLLTVHPSDCAVRDTYASKLMQTSAIDARADVRTAGTRYPTSPADLMLRIVNLMVDGYLALRRELTHQLDHWQTELLDPKTRFANWAALLDARQALHQLDEVCEDQRSCVQDWIEAVKTWPLVAEATEARERELLQVRSRDVLEHIERVVHHVRRLEQSVEAAVQMHFSAQSHRTNDIMRTLTALTAIFLPLNLIAGIFGMNFEFIPLLHLHTGFWWAMGSMLTIAAALGLVFWRKRYLSRSAH